MFKWQAYNIVCDRVFFIVSTAVLCAPRVRMTSCRIVVATARDPIVLEHLARIQQSPFIRIHASKSWGRNGTRNVVPADQGWAGMSSKTRLGRPVDDCVGHDWTTINHRNIVLQLPWLRYTSVVIVCLFRLHMTFSAMYGSVLTQIAYKSQPLR